MNSSRKLVLFLVLSAGCSAGAVAGTGAPSMVGLDAGGTRADDSGRTSDVSSGDGRDDESDAALALDASLDAAQDSAAHDSATKDSGANDATLDATLDANLDANLDATLDSGLDAAKDADDDAALDAATDSGSDAGVCSIDDGTWVASSSQYHIIAKGSLWRLDVTGKLVSSSTLASISGMANGPCANQVGTCHIDALTWRDDLAQYHIVHGGKLWRLDDHGLLLGTTTLTNFAGIAKHPCAGKVGAACVFEAGAWRQDLAEYELVVDGTIWGVTEAGAITASRPLLSIAGVAAGPCAGQVGTCHVEGFTYRPDTAEYHVIAKGSLYVIGATGELISTISLMSFSGLANGPCK